MLGSERIPDWRIVEGFTDLLARCDVRRGDAVVLVVAAGSDPDLVTTCSLAGADIGADLIELRLDDEAATGDLDLQGATAAAMRAADFVIDCTAPGLTGTVLAAALVGDGVCGVTLAATPVVVHDLMEVLDPDELLASDLVLAGATGLTVLSADSAQLRIDLTDATTVLDTGVPAETGGWSRWPSGALVIEPAQGAGEGAVALGPGDVLSTATGGLATSQSTIELSKGAIAGVEGDGPDAVALGLLSVGTPASTWRIRRIQVGLNPAARWYRRGLPTSLPERVTIAGVVSLELDDPADPAARLTVGMRSCTVTIDGTDVVVAGVVRRP